jgi:hypothetical protein
VFALIQLPECSVKRIIVDDRAAVTKGFFDNVLEWIVPAMEHVVL